VNLSQRQEFNRPLTPRARRDAQMEMLMNDNSEPHLTASECEVMERFVQGDRDKEIADHLGISPATVEMHLRHITSKFQSRSRGHLGALYVEWRKKGTKSGVDGKQAIRPTTGSA